MAEKDAENLVWQKDAMIVSNGPKDMSEEMLIAFLKENGKLEIVHVFPGRKPGTFLVYCQSEIDFEDVQRMCQNNPLKGNQLKVDRIKEINSVQVKNVSSNVSSDSLRRYFGSRKKSFGGDISSVQQQTSDTYIISFKEAYVVLNVCRMPHQLEGVKLDVQPFWKPPEENIISKQQVHDYSLPTKFHLNFLKKHRTEVNDQLKSLADVLWEDSKINKLRFKYSEENFEEIEQCLKDLLNSITVETIDVPDDMFEDVVGTVDSEDERKYFSFDNQYHKAHILGFDKSNVIKMKKRLLDNLRTEREDDLSIHERRILSDLGFFEQAEGQFEGLKVTVLSNKVVFEGQFSEIDTCQKKMYKILKSIVKSKLCLPLNTGMIINKKQVKEYLDGNLRNKKCIGSWETGDGDSVLLYASDKTHLSLLEEIMKEIFVANTLDFVDKIKDTPSHVKWLTFVESLKEEFPDFCFIGENSIVAVDFVVNDIKSKIDNFEQSLTYESYTSRPSEHYPFHRESNEQEFNDFSEEKVKDAFHSERTQEQIVNVKYKNCEIVLKEGDITTLDTDAIVNAANGRLEHRGGVAAAIVKKGGFEIQVESNKIMERRRSELKTGEVVSTKAGKLKCKTIIHAVGPVWNNGRDQEMDYLSRAVQNCLAVLEEKSYTSIAIPAISTGVYGIPKEKGTECIVTTIKEYLDTHSNSKIKHICLIDEQKEVIRAFKLHLETVFGISKSRETTSFYTSLLGPQQKAAPMTPRTNVASGENAGIKIQLLIDSISNASVDVIVNSTNKNLELDSGAISKYILFAAGPQIQDECSQKYPQGISTSEIAITKGYNLKCKNVFHLALPPWDEYSSDSILANLTQIITTCLENAERMGAKSLAFPILGAKMKYPIEKLPRTMYEAVKNYSDQNSSQIKDVYFVVLPQEDKKIAKKFEEYLLNKDENEGMMDKQEKERFHSKDTTSSNTSLHVSQKEPSSVVHRTNVASGENAGIKIQLLIDSISNASVDVIVNSSNKNLRLSDGSISKSIFNAAGSQIQDECNQKYPRGISTSEIAITKGYNLKCKNVFHLALPSWDEYSSDSILANLTQIITICLENAEELGAKSLAFPILGAGVLKYPVEELPRTMYEAVKSYSNLNSSRIKDVCFVVYPQDTVVVKKFEEYFQVNTTGSSAASSAAPKSESTWRQWLFGKKTEPIPDTWSSMGDKELIKIVRVTNGSEYDDIQATFRRNLPSYHIIKIERIQNRALYQRYQSLKKQFEAENPSITNEVDGLWHGTTVGSVDRINKYGFNHSSCGKNGTRGEGVYFSKKIRYSADDTYSTPDHRRIKTIYKCSVLVGRMIQGPRD
ncbi:protein mono-ADP-ribosyltransferase PARP14-like isoform X1 [Octopus vulgaris]|uniref:Poly [ADP-ribose] polymerase n=1 Tax=Octopus vulgaris TaxID=6645 RepID=A0AA36AIB5_OCTVU|nr:protein mono-ADP-ribosyltransferase PARP14-like isoform X1 [Octopus vulgaris]